MFNWRNILTQSMIVWEWTHLLTYTISIVRNIYKAWINHPICNIIPLQAWVSSLWKWWRSHLNQRDIWEGGGRRREEGYELVDISHGEPPPPPPPPPPAKLEEMYEVPLSFAPPPSQPLPAIPLPHTDDDTEEKTLLSMSFLEICDSTFTFHGVNVDCN